LMLHSAGTWLGFCSCTVYTWDGGQQVGQSAGFSGTVLQAGVHLSGRGYVRTSLQCGCNRGISNLVSMRCMHTTNVSAPGPLTLQCVLQTVPKSSAVALATTSGTTTCARSVSSTAGLSAQPPRMASGSVTSVGPGWTWPLALSSVNVSS
jgi:hypothetical protein